MRSPSGVKIMVYHWIDRDPGQRLREWGLTPEAFEAQMLALAEGGYQVLPLNDVIEVVRGRRTAPPRSVALTFDDGYLSLMDHALPVLKRLGFPATFFLVSDRVGATNTWDARHGDRPRSLMGWSEAAELVAQGMEIGSHSRTHPVLTGLAEAEMENEIRGSKETIENRLGRPVRHFSYPHGIHDVRCQRLVAEAGYAGACSTLFGGNGPGTNPYRLHRSEISYYDTPWSFSFKVRTGFGMRSWARSAAGDLLRRLVPTPRGVAS